MRKTRTFKQLRSWIVTLIVCLLIVGSAVVVVSWPRSALSDTYRYYSEVQGVRAYYFKDFQINDTLFIDVVMLEAEDSSGWDMLKSDFCMPVLDSITQRKIDNGKDLIFVTPVKMDNYCETPEKDAPECVMKVTSFVNRTVCLFQINSLEERKSVYVYNLEKSIKNSML